MGKIVTEEDSWNKWSMHVLKELERLNECYEGLLAATSKINEKVVVIEKECMVIESIKSELDSIKNKLAVANGIEEGKKGVKHEQKDTMNKWMKIWMLLLTLLSLLTSCIVIFKH
jgi:hypothetical protein